MQSACSNHCTPRVIAVTRELNTVLCLRPTNVITFTIRIQTRKVQNFDILKKLLWQANIALYFEILWLVTTRGVMSCYSRRWVMNTITGYAYAVINTKEQTIVLLELFTFLHSVLFVFSIFRQTFAVKVLRYP